jgi:hypothetical protein
VLLKILTTGDLDNLFPGIVHHQEPVEQYFIGNIRQDTGQRQTGKRRFKPTTGITSDFREICSGAVPTAAVPSADGAVVKNV